MNVRAEAPTVQTYQVFVKATPERVWDAITTPEFTRKYFHGSDITIEPDRILSLGPDGSVWMDDPVLEFDPPRRLVHVWTSRWDPGWQDEEPSRVTWEIDDQGNGLCKLTVVHDQLEGAPRTAATVQGAGWMLVLSGLKTLLETGDAMVEAQP